MFVQRPIADYYDYFQSLDTYTAIAVLVGAVLAYVLLASTPQKFKLPHIRLSWIIIGAAIIRFPQLFESMWYDETFSGAMVRVEWSNFLLAVSGDVHPPLYYAIQKVLVDVFGYSAFVLRLPAFVSGLALIVAVYHIGKRYGGERVGIMAALLEAIMPTLVYYSAEARYPSFLALMVALSVIGIMRQRPALFALALVAVAWTHTSGAIYVAILATYAALRFRSLRWLVAGAIPSLAVLAWLPVVVAQSATVSDGFWLMPQLPFNHVLDMTTGKLYSHSLITFACMIIVTAISFMALYEFRRKADVLFVVVLILPPVAQAVISDVYADIYLSRTLIISAVFVLIAVAWWIIHQPRRVLVYAALPFVLVGVVQHWQDTRASLPDVFAHCDGADYAYATNTHTAILSHHYSQPPTVVYPHGDSISQQLTHDAKAAMLTVDHLDNLSGDICVIAQISVFNTRKEMHHLDYIALRYNPEIEKLGYDTSEINFGYYVMMRFEK